MSNVIGGGVKIHLKKYSGVEMRDGKPSLRLTKAGSIHMACGGRNIGMKNATDFSEYRREHPEWCCKKCVARFDSLVSEAKKLQAQREIA